MFYMCYNNRLYIKYVTQKSTLFYYFKDDANKSEKFIFEDYLH